MQAYCQAGRILPTKTGTPMGGSYPYTCCAGQLLQVQAHRPQDWGKRASKAHDRDCIPPYTHSNPPSATAGARPGCCHPVCWVPSAYTTASPAPDVNAAELGVSPRSLWQKLHQGLCAALALVVLSGGGGGREAGVCLTLRLDPLQLPHASLGGPPEKPWCALSSGLVRLLPRVLLCTVRCRWREYAHTHVKT